MIFINSCHSMIFITQKTKITFKFSKSQFRNREKATREKRATEKTNKLQDLKLIFRNSGLGQLLHRYPLICIACRHPTLDVKWSAWLRSEPCIPAVWRDLRGPILGARQGRRLRPLLRQRGRTPSNTRVTRVHRRAGRPSTIKVLCPS